MPCSTLCIKPEAAHRHKIFYCVIPDSGTEKNTTLGDSLEVEHLLNYVLL